MLLDLDKFYNSNYKDFVHKEALEEALKQVPEAFLRDIDAKAILSITFSVDDVGENPIYITYLDKDNKEHIVKLRPNITSQLTEVLKRYPTKVEMNEALEEVKTTITNEYTIFVNAEVETLNNTINSVNTSLTQAIRDTLDEAKQYTDTKHNEALTAIETGDTQTLADSKAYADTKHSEALAAIETGDTQTLADSKAYTDTKHSEALAAIETGDTQTLENSKAYTDIQLASYETKAEATTDHDKLLNVPAGKKQPYISWYPGGDCKYIRLVKDGTETKLHINKDETDEDIGYLSKIKPSAFATTTDLAPLANKLSNIWETHKAPFIYWLPNIDVNTMKLENTENDVKVTLDGGDVVYWRKNEYQPSGAQLKVGFGTELPKTENSIVIRADSSDKTIGAMYFTAGGDTASFRPDTYIKTSEAPIWSWAGNVDEKRPSSVTLSDFYDGYIRFNIATYNSIDPDLREVVGYMPRSMPVTAADVEALVQEQNATNTENVAVSLQQKSRTTREVTNNSTLVNTKDFYILNLDFSFVPNVLPTSVENSFIENILIDAPEFNGKSFNITFKANEHTATSKGKVGEPLNIKTCVFPADETIKIVEVVVKDKIIIRKETE